MVRPGLRSRSMKRLKRRSPSGEARIIYRRRKKHVAHCMICGRPLGGVTRDRRDLRRGPKTAKRPERYFGGVICPDCLRAALKIAARAGL